MTALWTMDGYGPYVWTCYAAFVLMLLWDVAMPWLRRRHVLADMQRRVRREAAKKANMSTRTEAGDP